MPGHKEEIVNDGRWQRIERREPSWENEKSKSAKLLPG